MPTQDLNDASVFVWSRERELVPVYDRLLSVASTSECLEEIKELCDIQNEKMTDCTALLAAVGIEPPGNYMSLDTSGDLDTLLPLIWSRENEALDQGWLRVDPLIDDEAARAILLRGSRRHSRQMQLIREIARKCNITLIIVNTQPGSAPGHMPGPGPWPIHPSPAPPVMGTTQYIVQQGDTMWIIAKRFGVSLDDLIRANPQVRNPDLINVGEVLRIPGAGSVMPGPYPIHDGGGGRRYVVRMGDTIEIIAVRFSLNVTELTAFNPDLRPPYTLTPGQVLMIPSMGAVG